MTDRQKGILASLNLEFGELYNRFCTRHVCANLKVRFLKVELRNQYWRTVRASNKNMFIVAMKDIQDIDHNAFEWLRKLNPKYLSVHTFDNSIKCDHTINNMTES